MPVPFECQTSQLEASRRLSPVFAKRNDVATFGMWFKHQQTTQKNVFRGSSKIFTVAIRTMLGTKLSLLYAPKGHFPTPSLNSMSRDFGLESFDRLEVEAHII